MKRGKISSHEAKAKPEALVIRARINSGEPESIRVLRSIKAPELGQIFEACPRAFARTFFKRLFALNLSH
jgi:hypothetical protein